MTSWRCRKLRWSLLRFLKFCSIFLFFSFFWKFPKYWTPVFGWDTPLLKLNIWLLQRNPKPNNANSSLMWPPFHSKWPHIGTGSSGDHFWHFWNFAEFLCFSDFFGNFPNIETPYWLRCRTFKVGDMRFTKEFRT